MFLGRAAGWLGRSRVLEEDLNAFCALGVGMLVTWGGTTMNGAVSRWFMSGVPFEDLCIGVSLHE